MASNSSFRSWVNRLVGASEQDQDEEAPGTSSGQSPATGSMSAAESSPVHRARSSPSMTSVTPVSSDTSENSKESRQKRSLLGRSFKKDKGSRGSNVTRTSVVDSRLEIIPRLSNLPPNEETSQKLARVLEKFNSMDLAENLPPVSEDEVDK
uniref:Uncharacterized protein n=1 Tax=Graphocephala atropunctata TaxID=36148 RepID=A0A1B6MPT7_9HEMI